MEVDGARKDGRGKGKDKASEAAEHRRIIAASRHIRSLLQTSGNRAVGVGERGC